MKTLLKNARFNGKILSVLCEDGKITAIGAELGVDFAHTYSCYCGGERHCGQCATCRERKESFATAGIPDPTSYERV